MSVTQGSNYNAGDPAFNPATWSLGYQHSQFGLCADPVPTGTGPLVYPSIYSGLANPPAGMTASVELAIPTAPNLTPTE